MKVVPPAWHISDLAPPRVYSSRGAAMTFAEAAARGRQAAAAWRNDQAPGPTAAFGQSGDSVLLGGAGFLGADIAARLLQDGGGPVYVVSRRPGAIEAAWRRSMPCDRATALMADSRLHLVEADLATGGMEWMADVPRCGAVFHLAARMDAFSGWSGLQDVNLGSLRHATALARRDGALLQLASTLSLCVSSNWNPDGEEGPPPSADLWLSGGYAQTKAAAEFALLASPDVRQQIVRLGLLVPGPGNPFPAGHFAPMFGAALEKVGLPSLAEEAAVDITPVASAADTAVRLARSGLEGIFHWANPEPCTLSMFTDALAARRCGLGLPDLHETPLPEWQARLGTLPRLQRALLEAAFHKTSFLEGAARRGPLFNVDLFQATGRRFCIGRALGAGCAPPASSAGLLPGLLTSAHLEAPRTGTARPEDGNKASLRHSGVAE